MATRDEIKSAMKLLAGARLGDTPAIQDIPNVIETWGMLLGNVPGETLNQAVIDHIRVNTFWPRPAEILERAGQVKIHNGQSATPDPFKNESRIWKIIKGGAWVTQSGWEAFTIDPTKPRKVKSIYPPEVLAELAEIEARTGEGLMSDADFSRSEVITAPYLAKAFPVVNHA